MAQNLPTNAGDARGMGSAPVFLAWKIPWPEQPGRLQTMGSKELDMTEHTRTQDGRMGSKEENYSNDNWDLSSPALTP